MDEEHTLMLENIAFIDSVSAFLQDLFRTVLSGEKAWVAAARLGSQIDRTWSDELDEDLQRAAKVMASAWRYRGMQQRVYPAFY